ncbi:MAG: TPM domain-containing protein [Caulobacteraceae bacterium]
MIRAGGVLALLLALVFAPALAAAPSFPALTGRVVDDAHVLTPQVQADLTAKLASLEQQTTRQLVVVTLPGLGGYDIQDYGYQLLRKWGIGQKGTNNGALFIVVPSEHKVRIEVGYGLEPVLTDALSSVILQQAVLPKFRAGDVSGGVVDGTDAIVQQLSLPDADAQAKVAQAARPPARHFSPFGAIVPIVFIFFLVSSIFGRRGGGGMGWLLPMMILGGSRGGWGGGGGGFGGGGGGFSGGGGSGGGGGASGGW